MRNGLSILGAALVLFATSWKKDDKETFVSVQTLTGTYKLSKITITAINSPEQDFTDYVVEDCHKDDIHQLNADMSYKIVDAGTSCGEGDYADKWSLTNTTTIVVDDETYTIRKFDGKNLELTQGTTYMGVTSTLISYFVKQ